MEATLTILYRDKAVAVCIKPAGTDAQRGMPALLQAQCGGAFYCVHRLDRDVGGVMVYAASPAAAASLSRSVADGQLEKDYLAVCAGHPDPASGTLRDLLFHDTAKNKTYVVKRQRKGVKEALLQYKTLEVSDGVSLVRVRLLTGRTHQIRVQFASRGMPLLGDVKYGSRERVRGIALWSASLSFPHPLSGERLRFSAPPPITAPWDRFSLGGADHA